MSWTDHDLVYDAMSAACDEGKLPVFVIVGDTWFAYALGVVEGSPILHGNTGQREQAITTCLVIMQEHASEMEDDDDDDG